jgi:hypothetical protein
MVVKYLRARLVDGSTYVRALPASASQDEIRRVLTGESEATLQLTIGSLPSPGRSPGRSTVIALEIVERDELAPAELAALDERSSDGPSEDH